MHNMHLSAYFATENTYNEKNASSDVAKLGEEISNRIGIKNMHIIVAVT